MKAAALVIHMSDLVRQAELNRNRANSQLCRSRQDCNKARLVYDELLGRSYAAQTELEILTELYNDTQSRCARLDRRKSRFKLTAKTSPRIKTAHRQMASRIASIRARLDAVNRQVAALDDKVRSARSEYLAALSRLGQAKNLDKLAYRCLDLIQRKFRRADKDLKLDQSHRIRPTLQELAAISSVIDLNFESIKVRELDGLPRDIYIGGDGQADGPGHGHVVLAPDGSIYFNRPPQQVA